MTAAEWRRQKVFVPGDIVLYAVVALLVVAVVLAVFLPREARGLVAVEVYYGEQMVYRYDCAAETGQAYPIDGVTVTERTAEGVLTVTVHIPEGTNVLVFDRTSARVAEADCRHTECVRAFAPITRGGDMIACMPHRLRLVGVGDVGDEVVL